MNAVTTAIKLETRAPRKNGAYPVKLRVTFQRKQRYYSLLSPYSKSSIVMSKSYYGKVMGEKPRGQFRDDRFVLDEIHTNARKIIQALPEFSFTAFEAQFLQKRRPTSDVYAAMKEYIERLINEGRVSTANPYGCALQSLRLFRKNLTFDDITPDFLNEYEKWMVDNQKSITTVGIYLRSLRAVYNDAVKTGICKSGVYPFGKGRYQIPKGINVKKALGRIEMKKLYHCELPRGSWEERARDLWMLSYLCNGANMKDLLLLKNENIDGNKLRFTREKTKRTARTNPRLITVQLKKKAMLIIDRHRSKSSHPNDFIFQFIQHGFDATKIRATVQQVVKMVNTYMRKIAAEVGIDKHITTYHARHTFATVLKRKGQRIEYISEALGHSTVATTETYLDSFEDDQLVKAAEAVEEYLD